MKRYLSIFLLFLIFGYSQISKSATNQDIIDTLEDIELQRQMDRTLDRLNRESDRLTDELIRLNQKNYYLPPKVAEPNTYKIPYSGLPLEEYKSFYSSTERSQLSKFYNLNIGEFMRRDEVAYYQCSNYKKLNTSHALELWNNCYDSIMLSITNTEILRRRNKIKSSCSYLPQSKRLFLFESKQEICIREILVFDK